MDQQYLSVAEFADLVGLSKQAIYKRLKSDLKPYEVVKGNVKYISAEAMEIFTASKEPAEDRAEPLDQPKQEPTDQQSYIDYLVLQIAEKDKLIQQLQQIITDQTTQIRELNSHIMRQSETLTETIQSQNQLQQNFQMLLGHQQQHITALSTVEQPVEQPVEIGKKRGFLSRIFKG